MEKGRLKKGQKVSIQSWPGGVGTFTIHLNKHLGVTVVNTASVGNAGPGHADKPRASLQVCDGFLERPDRLGPTWCQRKCSNPIFVHPRFYICLDPA